MSNQDTFNLDKNSLVERAFGQMDQHLAESNFSLRQKVALTCRVLFDNGHDSG